MTPFLLVEMKMMMVKAKARKGKMELVHQSDPFGSKSRAA